jgi:ATP-dependent protease ClpP protease subunit
MGEDMNRTWIPALAVLLAATTAPGDVITRRDGSSVSGKIVQEDGQIVTLQSNVDSLIMRTKIARKDIVSIKRDAKADVSFCQIPIEGEIGSAVKAEWLASALAQARSLNADTVILYFDSGGGRISEMIKIIDLLKQNKDLHLIAHVKNAQSAAAIIAMCCPRIVVTPGGAIGACVPYKMLPDGTPQDIQAKYLSYFGAIARSACEAGGHAPLLVRGMIEMDLVLSVVRTGRKIAVVEGEAAGGTVIKKTGQILTLQGREAVDSGLACGIGDDLIANPTLVDVKSWASVGDAAWSYMKSRENVAADAPEQFTAMRTRLAAQTATANRALDTARNLAEQAKKEAQAANDEYIRAGYVNRMPSEIEPARKKALAKRDAQLATIAAKYRGLIEKQKRIYEDAAADAADWAAKLQRLQAQR